MAVRWRGLKNCFLFQVRIKPYISTVSQPQSSASNFSFSNMSKSLVAVCQITSSSDKSKNFSHCESLIKEAKNNGAAIVFLPECFDYIGKTKEESVKLAETLDGETITHYKKLARDLCIWLSLGGFHRRIPTSDRICNTHILIDDVGEISATYDKAHMFDVNVGTSLSLAESSYTAPGNAITPPVKTCIGMIGLMVCYDLRFPQISSILTHQGAQILTYPSAFTRPTGEAHWEALLRSRAIENQCYVVAAAQVGFHNEKRSSYGHSMIIDPWGRKLADCADNENLALAEIDLGYLSQVREQMNVQQHQRHDLYSLLPNKPVEANSECFLFHQHSIPASCVFYESSLCFAFVNRKPVVAGHVLVCPKRVVARVSDLAREEISDLFLVVQRISDLLQKYHQATSSTISIQDGPEAGQTAEHVHVHILPRKPGDFQNNDDIYVALEQHDKENVESFRSLENMSDEAQILKQLMAKN